jgi:hypothetical protein
MRAFISALKVRRCLDFISAPFPRQRFYTLLSGPNFGEHFIIAPFVFVVSLFKSNLNFYELHNNGAWYNFGYLFGLACFFGGGGHGSARRK